MIRFLLWFVAIAIAPSLQAASCDAVFPSVLNPNHTSPLTPLVSGGASYSAGNNKSLSITAGDNHAFSSFITGKRFDLIVSGSGTARLHIAGSMSIGSDAEINAGGDAEDLVIYVAGSLSIAEGAEINAYIYVGGSVSLGQNIELEGAISAAGPIATSSNSDFEYEDELENTDFAGMCSAPPASSNSCSVYLGTVRFNEFFKDNSNQSASSADFLELKVIGSSPDRDEYEEWTIEICESKKGKKGSNNSGDGCSGEEELEDVFDDLTAPWLVWKGTTPGRYMNFKTGFNAILRDEDGKVVDYFSMDGHDSLMDANCNGGDIPYDWDADKPGGGEKIVHRIPDGTGPFDTVTSGAVPPTENDTNDGVGSSPPDHFAISVSGSGLTCEPVSVTITAHDAAHGLVSTAVGTVIQLSTSTGQGLWSNPSEGSLSNLGGGQASYTFTGSGTVTLSFNHFTAATVNFNINAGSSPNEAGTEDPSVLFRDSGFRFLDVNGVSLIDTQISGMESAIHSIQAVRTGSDQSCVAAFPPGVRDVEFAVECLDPSTCAGGVMTLDSGGASVALSAVDSNGVTGAAATYQALSLTFGAEAKAPFTLNYSDAGQMELHAQAPILDGAGNPTGAWLSGSSNPFVVKPYGFCIETGDAASACAANSVTGCDVFKRAGELFPLQVSARAYSGVAESGSALCNNPVTPNFKAAVQLSSNVIAPAAGVDGTLAQPLAVISSGGSVTVNQAFSEVGIFQIEGVVNDYIQAGIDVGPSASDEIGRIIPWDFHLPASAVVTEACSATFSYMGQPFGISFDLLARNQSGGITENYRDDFARLDSYIELDLVAKTAAGNLSARLQEDPDLPLLLNWVNGTVAVTGNLIVQRDATLTPDGPFQPDDGVAPAEDPIQLGINPTDEDGVLPAAGSYDLDLSSDGSNDHLLLTDQADIRYGRLVVENAYGPENRDLPMPVTAEYWDGATFVKNLDDSCSALLRDAGVLDGALPTAVAEPIVTTPLVSGKGVLLLSAPGVSGTTELRLDLNDDGLGEPTLNLPWLQFDWDGTGVATDPTGLATFGRFRGHDRIILWRELN